MGVKDAFLGVLREQLRQLAVNEAASGKLKSPVDLDEVCGRLIPAFRKNPLTAVQLKMLKVSDGDLKELFKGVFVDIGMEVKTA